MRNPSFPLTQFRSKELSDRMPHQGRSETNFLDAHNLGGIVRGLFLSSILWAFLAFAVYTVYGMIAGTH